MTILTRIGDIISADYGLYRTVGMVMPAKALSDKLWKPWKLISYNPVITVLVVIVVYPILCILIFPFFLISFVLSSIGSWIVFFGIVGLGTRSLARTMIFPGSLRTVQRDVSQEYMKGIINQFNRIATMSSDVSVQIIGLVSTGNTHNCAINLDDITSTCDKILPILLLIVKEGYDAINTENEVDIASGRCLQQLYLSGRELLSCVATLRQVLQVAPMLAQVVAAKSNELSAATMACIDACSDVNTALLEIKGRLCLGQEEDGSKPSGWTGQFMSNIRDFFRRDTPLEKASFPMMRKHICTMHPSHSSSPIRAREESLWSPAERVGPGGNGCASPVRAISSRVRRMRLMAAEGHIIDAIMVYAHDVDGTEEYPLTAVPTVLFCPPNAGFYECLSMSQPGGSWLWYYANHLGKRYRRKLILIKMIPTLSIACDVAPCVVFLLSQE